MESLSKSFSETLKTVNLNEILSYLTNILVFFSISPLFHYQFMLLGSFHIDSIDMPSLAMHINSICDHG